MKKHPVDDLFKRKLEGLERTPSENAWLKIRESQPANSRSVVWGWYAAAGVAAAVMGGYLVWQSEQDVLPGGIKTQRIVAAARPVEKKDLGTSPVENLNESVEHLPAAEKAGNALAENEDKNQKRASNAPETASSRIAQTQRAEKHNIKVTIAQPEPEPNALAVAIVEKPSVLVNATQAKPAEIPVSQDIKTLPDKPAVSQVNKPEPEPTRTIIVEVETGTKEAEEKPRHTRFARVFRQLKNARAGEKVDWDEVGFNPKDLVARVDDRLRSKDEKKDHPKDKTKL